MLNGIIFVAQVVAGVFLYARFGGEAVVLYGTAAAAFAAQLALLRWSWMAERTGTTSWPRALGMALAFAGFGTFATLFIALNLYRS